LKEGDESLDDEDQDHQRAAECEHECAAIRWKCVLWSG
jgi:hypothetical protein